MNIPKFINKNYDFYAVKVFTTFNPEKDLEFAKARQQERDARFAAGLKLAGTAVGQGLQNTQGGGSFFTPAGLDTAMAADGGVGGLMGRLRVGSYGSYDPVSGEYRGG